jgi:hypothetical protein
MRTLRFALLLAASLLCLAAVQAATVTVAPGADGRNRVVLDNGQVRLEVDPARGARVDSYRFSPWGATEIIGDKSGQGLFLDHFWQEPWPGQLWERKYEYQIVSPGPEVVSVKFSCLTVDRGVPQVAGILLEKTMTLRENEPTVQVTIRLTNQGAEGKYLGYWMQNICWPGGDKNHTHYYRPSKRGVLEVTPDADAPDAGFVREPQAGWTAALDDQSHTGLVWFMDYNFLWFLYNCDHFSIEWQDDALAIPPGKSWETSVTMAPFSRMSEISYASERLLLGAAYKEDKAAGRLEVTEHLVATAHPLKNVAVRTSLETLVTHQQVEGPAAQTIPELGSSPQTVSVALPWDTAKREPVVVRVSLQGQTEDGKDFSEKAELFYSGAWVADTVPMDGSPLYTFPSPPQVKALVKPDKIARIVTEKPQVLYLKGLLTPDYRLEPALRQVSPEVTIKEGFHYNGGTFGWGLDYFPYDYDALMSNDLIIIGDINASALNETGIEMLKDYCEHGGNLLVLGGPYAYGDGGYQSTQLAQLLPVVCRGAFDLQPAGAGTVKSALPAQVLPPAQVQALAPQYLNLVTAKPGAQVLLSYGGRPLLVQGTFGEGKVYCLTAPPLGQPCYCDTPQWQRLLRYVFTQMGINR